MLVREVMSKNVKTVSPDQTLIDVAKQMRDGDFGVMPVCEGDKIVGMLTDRDIVVRAAADGADLSKTKVRDAMTDEVLTCMEDDDVNSVSQLMSDRQVRRIAVLGKNKRLLGILSIGDLAEKNESLDEAGLALSKISEKRHDEPGQSKQH